MQSPLHFAARTGQIEVIEKILEKEANEKNPKDENGLTPFHWAAQNGNLDICQLFMKHLKEKSQEIPVQKSTTSLPAQSRHNRDLRSSIFNMVFLC